MDTWAIQLIISLAGVIVTLGAVIGYMRNSLKPSNPNGAKKLNGEFTTQVKECNDRFMEIAEDRGEVKASLKNIEVDIADIKDKLSRRR